MSPWKLAMLALLPFLAAVEWRSGPRPMLRTWAALMGGSLLAVALVQLYPAIPVREKLMAYFLLDTLTAALIWAQPRGQAQTAIFALSIVMLSLTGGFYAGRYIGHFAGSSAQYDLLMLGAGWVQFLILAGWIGHGCYRLAVPAVSQRDGVGVPDGFAS